ncbi:MAG: PIN domain protein [Bacteroidota bacterium]|nr:PIN domain protein [Bacteroidota bacterium]
MKKQKVYLDTSVIGGCFDLEFKEDSNKIIELIKLDIYEGVISSITIDELEDAPDYVKEILNEVDFNILFLNEDVISLAKKYLNEKIISEKYKSDCQHIAIATIFNVDVLISWNFKHIVNLNKIKQFNLINLKEGYKQLEIRSPKELIYE